MLAEMISLERRHFRLNRILLLVIGLWPYQKSKFTQIQFFVLFSILISFSAFQVRIHKSIFSLSEKWKKKDKNIAIFFNYMLRIIGRTICLTFL